MSVCLCLYQIVLRLDNPNGKIEALKAIYESAV